MKKRALKRSPLRRKHVLFHKVEGSVSRGAGAWSAVGIAGSSSESRSKSSAADGVGEPREARRSTSRSTGSYDIVPIETATSQAAIPRRLPMAITQQPVPAYVRRQRVDLCVPKHRRQLADLCVPKYGMERRRKAHERPSNRASHQALPSRSALRERCLRRADRALHPYGATPMKVFDKTAMAGREGNGRSR